MASTGYGCRGAASMGRGRALLPREPGHRGAIGHCHWCCHGLQPAGDCCGSELVALVEAEGWYKRAHRTESAGGSGELQHSLDFPNNLANLLVNEVRAGRAAADAPDRCEALCRAGAGNQGNAGRHRRKSGRP